MDNIILDVQVYLFHVNMIDLEMFRFCKTKQLPDISFKDMQQTDGKL